MMTKKQFRLLANEAIDRLCDMPDEIWQATFPLMRIAMRTREETVTVVVGLEGESDEPVEL